MTTLITTPCFLVNTVRIPIILKLIVLLADTFKYILIYPVVCVYICKWVDKEPDFIQSCVFWPAQLKQMEITFKIQKICVKYEFIISCEKSEVWVTLDVHSYMVRQAGTDGACPLQAGYELVCHYHQYLRAGNPDLMH